MTRKNAKTTSATSQNPSPAQSYENSIIAFALHNLAHRNSWAATQEEFLRRAQNGMVDAIAWMGEEVTKSETRRIWYRQLSRRIEEAGWTVAPGAAATLAEILRAFTAELLETGLRGVNTSTSSFHNAVEEVKHNLTLTLYKEVVDLCKMIEDEVAEGFAGFSESEDSTTKIQPVMLGALEALKS